MKIGLISDTHDYVDPKLYDIFSDVSYILHAGDITSENVIIELETIKPVIAVHGNSDYWPIINRYPAQRIVEFEGFNIYLTHIIGYKKDLLFRLRREKIQTTPHIAVFGHYHAPSVEKVHDILFINPGCAGQQRAKGRRSVAIFELNYNQEATYKFVEL
ncbi:MAG: metallophosphoesterase family protein [Calditrichia bacterium]